MSFERPPDIHLSAEEVLREEALLAEPKKKAPKPILAPETASDLVAEFNGLKQKYLERPNPDFAGFSAEFLESSEEYFQDSKTERALVYVYTHLGEMIEATRAVTRTKDFLARLQPGSASRQEIQHIRQSMTKQTLTCVRWQQEAVQLVRQLDEGGYDEILAEFWQNWQGIVDRSAGKDTTGSIRAYILSTLMATHAFRGMGVTIYLPPADLDAYHLIDLIGIPWQKKGEQILFIQNKSRAQEAPGFDVTAYTDDTVVDDTERLNFLNNSDRYARLWRIPHYLPVWMTTRGAFQLEGAASLTGRPEDTKELTSNLSGQLRKTKLRRTGK